MRYIKQILLLGIILLQVAMVPQDQEKKSKVVAQQLKPQTSTVTAIRIASPTLVAPLTETVDISGLEKLEFRWKPADVPFDVFCYLFSIYQSTDMSQKNEVYSDQVSGLDTSTEVSSDNFEDGGVYTWVVKEVNNTPSSSLIFSDPVYASFKIIKKPKEAK
jgi:hypothetical protein